MISDHKVTEIYSIIDKFSKNMTNSSEINHCKIQKTRKNREFMMSQNEV